MRTRLAVFDDVVEAEHVMTALNDAGIVAVDSVRSQALSGIGGSALNEFVIDVEEADLEKASGVLKALRPAAPTTAPPADVALRPSVAASYRRGANAGLVLSSGMVLLTLVQGEFAPAAFIGAAIDFFIWRRLHEPDPTVRGVARVRVWAMVRLAFGVLMNAVSGASGVTAAWVVVAGLVVALLFYLPAPEPSAN